MEKQTLSYFNIEMFADPGVQFEIFRFRSSSAVHNLISASHTEASLLLNVCFPFSLL